LLILFAIAGPSLTVAVTILAWILAEAALRPVRRMTREAATISLAESGRRLPLPPGGDEIAELGTTLNQMLARIESTVARERAFIDDASHELRTPLAVLRGEIELAAQDPSDTDSVRLGLQSALEETDRIAQLANDLLTLAKADAGQLAAGSNVTELVDAARAAVARVPRDDRIRIDVTGEPSLVHGEQRIVEQIITNLVANAARHANTRVAVHVTHDAVHTTLIVDDDGPGFAPELLAHAFERFTRADTSRGRGGTGLGLAIVAALTTALDGKVAATNDSTFGGARVTLEFQNA